MKTFKVTYYANIYVTKHIKAKDYDDCLNIGFEFDLEDLEDRAVMQINKQHLDFEVLDIDEIE